MIWSACFPFLTQKYKNDQILQYTDASPPPPPPKIIKTILERWVVRREVPDNGPPNSNKKGKDSCHSHSRETKHSLRHDNNQNKTLKGDSLTDSHTRKATFTNRSERVPSNPIPQAVKYTHAPKKKKKKKKNTPPPIYIYIYVTL